MGSVPRYLRGVQLDIDGTFGLDGFESLLSDDRAPDECPEMPIWFDFEPADEDLEYLASLSAATDRLERGLDASPDHAGSFVGHEG